MGCSSVAPISNVLWHSSVTQQAAPNLAVARSRTPAAMPLRRLLATCGLRHVQLRHQYSTRIHRLGTLMRHDLCRRWRWRWRCRCRRRRGWAMQLSLAISPRAPGMGKAPRAPALIASPRRAQRCTPRLCAALAAAVALPSVADAADHHLRMAACTHEQASTDRPGNGPGRRSSSRHRRARSSPENALRNEPNRRRSPWTSSPAGAILRTHSWLTRWGAADETTARSSRLPRPFYNMAQFYRVFASATRPRVPPRGLGGTPRQSLRHSRQASGSDLGGATRFPRAPTVDAPPMPPARHGGLWPRLKRTP